MPGRIKALDGLRAVAALSVVLYHYFSRWAVPEAPINYYPYGSAYSEIPLFQFGYMGVQLFFVISGFVIALTLFGSRGPIDFAVKRFARLWPAMVVCSTVTFVVLLLVPAHIFEEHIENFLPSWTFTHPMLFEGLLNREVDWVDGAYWSLFTEVRFYFWTALMFFLTRSWFFPAFATFAAGSIVLWAAAQVAGLDAAATGIRVLLIPEHISWFTMGIAAYQLYRREHERWAHSVNLVCVIVLIALALAHGQHALAEAIGVLVVAAIFYAFLYTPRLVAWLGSPAFAALGAASYSLYLLHQNLGVTLIVYLTPVLGLPGEMIAIAMIGACVLLSLAIYRFCEVPAKRLIVGWYGSLRGMRAVSLRQDPPGPARLAP